MMLDQIAVRVSVLTGALLLLACSNRSPSGYGPPLPTSVTVRPFEYHALKTDDEAIDRALELIGYSPKRVTARLTNGGDALSWGTGIRPPNTGGDELGVFERPTWIVALQGYGSACTYFLLDARNAMLITTGRCSSEQSEKLAKMPNEEHEIRFETPETLLGKPVTPWHSVPEIVTSTPEA